MAMVSKVATVALCSTWLYAFALKIGSYNTDTRITRNNFTLQSIGLVFGCTFIPTKKSGASAQTFDSVFDDPFPRSYPYKSPDFERLNEQDDSEFYSKPRFTEHVDDQAVELLKSYYSEIVEGLIDPYSCELPVVLDIGASWNSHLPELYYNKIKETPAKKQEGQNNDFFSKKHKVGCSHKPGKAIGIGLNSAELAFNYQLTDYLVQDLNNSPYVPYPAASIDLVVCAFTIDYLTRPRELLSECYRILRPGGKVAVVFSDRLFVTKAVRMWTGMGIKGKRVTALERARMIGTHLHFAAPPGKG
uniref:Methyltransferase type 11 domain-containing protein n=1 Tax=Heterosigma akashiwo TaxID=2829 RepID=A0A6V1RB93_HETAK